MEQIMQSMPLLAIVVPCYNEEQVLQETARQLLAILDGLVKAQKIQNDSFIYFVNDGSRDSTWQIISSLNATEKRIKALKLSGNFGHQNALFAGLSSVVDKVDCAITIDADLQDDVSVIEKMIDAFLNDSDIVYGVRSDRQSDSFIKKHMALLFYRLMEALGVKIINNHADFRLMSQRAINHLLEYKETNLFLRAIVPLIGFSSEKIYYSRKQRFSGVSKYPTGKMIGLALNGITSFSIAPLRYVAITGFIVLMSSLLLCAWALYLALSGITVPGWASTVLPIYFLGGLQLFSIGVLGEYLGKVYREVKRRPLFFKDKELF
ncbi:glycosyltransferase family 2 protein [Nitrospirota bacterium]